MNWRQRIVLIATVVLTLALASHPELRLLVPLLDLMGLDLLILLVGALFLDQARPWLIWLQHQLLLPLARESYALVIFLLGSLGPYLDGLARTRRIVG